MQNSQFNLAVILLVFLTVLGLGLAQDGPSKAESVKATDSWTAKHVKRAVVDAAPKSRVITTEKEWQTLWNRWRPVEELPKVDFNKDIIIVAVAMGPNTITVAPTFEAKGNLKIEVTSTLVADDLKTFSYVILKIPGAGIKTVDGKPLEKN